VTGCRSLGFGNPLPFTRYRLVIASISKVEAVDRTFAAVPRVELEHEMQHAVVAGVSENKP
jgi:hypothetical protein